MSALKEGQLAQLDVPQSTLTRVSKWLDLWAAPDGGRYGYREPHAANGFRPGTSSEGLLLRQYLGWGPRSPGLLSGLQYIRAHKPRVNEMYYSYYATQVMKNQGGQHWAEWRPQMRRLLLEAQDQGLKEAHQAGSWHDPTDMICSGHGGRIFQTSLSLMTLYRSANRDEKAAPPPLVLDPKYLDLLAALKHADENERVKAANELAQLKDRAQDASRSLCVCMLNSKTPAARTAAMAALESVHPMLHTPIASILSGDDEFKRLLGYQKIADLGLRGHAAAPVLLAELAKRSGDDLSQRAVIAALAKTALGDPAVDEALLKVSKPGPDASAAVRLDAQRVLAGWAAGRADLQRPLVDTLIHIGSLHVKEPASVPAQEVAHAVVTLGKFGVVEKARTLALLASLRNSSDEGIRQAVAEALAALK